MSGIRTGTRLERLYRLQHRIETEIQLELRANPPARITTEPRTDTTKERLDQLGVTPREVKEWAVSVGLLGAVRQGRVARHIVEAYAEAKGLR